MKTKPQVTTTVNRPGHIQTQPSTDEYRKNFDQIDWGAKHATARDAGRKYTTRAGKLTPNRYR